MRKILFTLMVVVLLGLTWGFTPVSTQAQEAERLLVALVGPLSGPAAPWGIAGLRGGEFAVEDINKAGGFKVGKKTYQLQIKGYDHKYDPSEAVSATRKAVHDGALLVIPEGGGCVPAQQSVTEPAGIIMIGQFAGGCKFINPRNPLTFQNFPPIGLFVEGTSSEYIPFFNVKRVAILEPDDELGREDGAYFKQYVPKKFSGVKIVADEYYERTTTDFYPVLGRIIAKKADYIYSSESPQASTALIVKQGRELGYKGPIITCSALTPSALLKAAGEKNLNLTTIRVWVKSPTPLFEELNQRHKARFGEEAIDTVQAGYENIRMWVRGIQKAGTLNSKEVAKAIEDSSYPDYIFGPAKWMDYGCGVKRCVEHPMAMAIFDGGKLYGWSEWKAMKK